METAEDSAVADFLQILEEHRRNCERQGKYVEAEIAKNRLEELKVREPPCGPTILWWGRKAARSSHATVLLPAPLFPSFFVG